MRLGQTPLSEMNILMELFGIQHLGKCDEQYHNVIINCDFQENVHLMLTKLSLLDTWCLPMLVESAAWQLRKSLTRPPSTWKSRWDPGESWESHLDSQPVPGGGEGGDGEDCQGSGGLLSPEGGEVEGHLLKKDIWFCKEHTSPSLPL